ncbi:MAG: serine/threonine protein kinase [Myxococcales bacterium]|nr:serine/threonine protein kinase [Myxococcales bacterium]
MESGDLVSGKYRLQHLLGAGSMGSVWAARNELTNHDFAVKFLLPELAKNEEALNRFFLEARACGQIRHPAIVDVYDMGRADDGSPYLVMELLEGEGMDARIARQGRLRTVDVCRYMSLVARGLEEAHMRGLIHRDLKPGNIFFAIDKSGEVYPRVLDFGISKDTTPEQFDIVKTNAGAVLGSPAYMSPEQARGELDVDARTDLWALGVILYEALTGEIPFDANNYNALMLKIITEPHQSVIERCLDVPAEISEVVDRLLEKDRSARIRSAGELADRLERIYMRLTDTPLTLPERHTSIPPMGGDGSTQRAWKKGSGQRGSWQKGTGRKDGRTGTSAILIGAAVAVLGIVGGAVVVANDGAPTAAVALRMGAEIDVLVERMRARAAEARSAERTLVLERAARDAEKRAADAERDGNAERDGKFGHAPSGITSAPAATKPPDPNDPHGGVLGPGF